MVREQLSVGELQEYWKTIKEGKVIPDYIETDRLPSWDDICWCLKWDVFTVEGGAFTKKHHGYCGVYRLFGLSDGNAKRPATICRLQGEDRHGTLYIGKSGWLNERLNQFRRSLESEGTHRAAVTWRRCATLRTRFPLSRLGIGLLYTAADMEGFIESDLIRAYLNTFGDTPPLNCSF